MADIIVPKILSFLKTNVFVPSFSINFLCVKEGLKKTQGRYWKIVDKHTFVNDCGFMNIFPDMTKKYRLILVKGQKQIERRISKNQRKQGRGHRAYRITYQEIIFGILTNIEGHPVHIYEFYKQRQTIENYFRDSNWSFKAGKLPSQQERSNQAYLSMEAKFSWIITKKYLKTIIYTI
jgi:hypothetical protein